MICHKRTFDSTSLDSGWRVPDGASKKSCSRAPLLTMMSLLSLSQSMCVM
jgi:hypothetical protein